MSVIQELPEADYPAFVAIVANAYPSFRAASAEDQQRLVERFLGRRSDPANHFYGLYRDARLLGGMILYDFTMQLLSVRAPAGGVGLVAVDLLHKKEKVARDMIASFLRHYRERGATLTLLYPFRPDFYKQMGFGYGTKTSQYRVRPADLPRGPTKEHVVYLRPAEKDLLRDCYNRCMAASNGLIEKSQRELDALFANPDVRIVACKPGDAISGYATFTFKSTDPDNPLANDIHVKEFLYEDRAALSELMTFFHSQADQIDRIVFTTQDEHFHFLLSDPRDGSGRFLPHVYHESDVQGVGLMYRVIDIPGIFGVLAGHSFGGQSCRVKLSIADSFLPENDGATIVHFNQGRAQVRPDGDYQVELRMDIAEFSSLLVGAVDLKSLYRYGLANLSDPSYLDTLQRLFAVESRPICTTPF